MLQVNKEMIHNSKERFLEIQPNGAGIWVGMKTYKDIKDKSEYTEAMKIIVPKMEMLTGTLSEKTFTGTGFKAVESPKNLVAFLFNNELLSSLDDAGDYKGMANPANVEAVKVTKVTETEITLEYAPDNQSFTNCVLLENDGYIDVAQITDFNSNESQNDINTNNKHSNGYESAIGGLKTSGIDGITGYYDPRFPSIATMNFAFDGEYTVKVRNGALKIAGTPYIEGVYKVGEFSHSGTLDGNNALSYTASLKLQSGMIEKKVWKDVAVGRTIKERIY